MIVFEFYRFVTHVPIRAEVAVIGLRLARVQRVLVAEERRLAYGRDVLGVGAVEGNPITRKCTNVVQVGRIIRRESGESEDCAKKRYYGNR